MTEETGRNILNFGQRAKIYEALKLCTEPDGEEIIDGEAIKYVKFIPRESDVTVAAVFSKEFGFPVYKHVVKEIRQQAVGVIRRGAPGAPRVSRGAAAQADIDGLRAVVAGLATKLENLRKVVEHFDYQQHKRRADCAAKLRDVIGKNREDDRVVRTKMRGAGYSEDEIGMGLYLVGAIVRSNGAASTVEIPPLR